MNGRLILYDTCNYRDYPVGGQITSIKNFLKYVNSVYPEHLKDILLVGVSYDEKEVGHIIPIEVGEATINFLAVTTATTNLGKVKRSLRLEYAKGLLKYKKLLSISVNDCNYIHTPEAFGVIKILCKRSICYVFSHGTYFDMWRRVRFFKKQPFIRKVFQRYLISVIKNCNAIFVLENETYEEYSKYNNNVEHVRNSIVCQDYFERNIGKELVKFIYAGRLSAVKNLEPIIEAIKSYTENVNLTILGDGEKYDELKAIANDRIHFMGAVVPDEVKKYMKKADILIMNSTFEGVPMTILESISLGLPVITTDVGGIKEVLDYGKDSEITDGTVDSIHIAMDRIISNYKIYALNAYNHSKQFDYRVINNKVFKIINRKLKW